MASTENIIHPLSKANLITDQQALELEEKAECGLMAVIATNKGNRWFTRALGCLTKET